MSVINQSRWIPAFAGMTCLFFGMTCLFFEMTTVVMIFIKWILFLMPVMFTGLYKTHLPSLKQIFKNNISKTSLNTKSTEQINQQHTLSPPNAYVGDPATFAVHKPLDSRHKHSGMTALLLRAACLLILITTPLQAISEQRIAVLYPEASSRASQLYNTIIKSMKQRNNVQIHSRAFSTDDSIADIQQWLADEKSQAVVLLGKKGMQFGTKLSLNIPIISGAHMQVQPNQSSVSLNADPQQLFEKLKKLQPDIKTVHVIYNDANSGWLIKQAQAAAHKNNIILNAIQANSMQDSGQALKQLVQKLDARKDAIWLPYDPILPVKPLLPDLLRKSWDKNLIIFSGNPYHVQQGTLFALFPDYSKLGPQLIGLALNKLKKTDTIYFEPSRYLNSAINVRTASHLGIQVSSVQRENYKMVFPKK